MRIMVDVDEAAERLEELVELAGYGDAVLICREGKPVAELTSISRATSKTDELRKLMNEGRVNVPAGTTSSHDDFYDDHGLPR